MECPKCDGTGKYKNFGECFDCRGIGEMAVIKPIKEKPTKKRAKREDTLHHELVQRAERWLKKSVGCGFVLKELVSITMETPDAIGWKQGQSILVECKASRADFLSDKKKLFRRNPDRGMGMYRFYLCPPGVINLEDLPDKWGLLYCHPKKIEKVVGPKGNVWLNFPSFEPNLQAEVLLMSSALRRVQIRGDLQKIYEQDYQYSA